MAKSLLKQNRILSDVIEADHQNVQLFVYKQRPFLITFIGLIVVLAKFHEYYFTNSSNWTLGIYFNHYFSLEIWTHMTTMLRVGSL